MVGFVCPGCVLFGLVGVVICPGRGFIVVLGCGSLCGLVILFCLVWCFRLVGFVVAWFCLGAVGFRVCPKFSSPLLRLVWCFCLGAVGFVVVSSRS